MEKKRRTIRMSVLLLSVSATLIVASSCLVLWFVVQASFFKAQLEHKVSHIAERLQTTLAMPLWSYDSAQMAMILEGELADPDLASIEVRELSGARYMGLERNGRLDSFFAGRYWAELTRPLAYHDLQLGTLTIKASGRASMEAFAARLGVQALLIFLVGAIVAFVLFRAVDTRISRRVSALRTEIGRFSGADLKVRATDRGADEIGELADTFNSMAGMIERYARDLEGLVAVKTGELVRAKADLEKKLVELRQAQDQIVESAKFAEIGRILSQVIHDLNTPIASILSTVDLLQSQGLAAIEGIPALSAGLDRPQAEILGRLSSIGAERRPRDDFRSRRTRRARVLEALGGREAAGAEDLADRLIEIDADIPEGLLADLVAKADRERIIAIAEALALLRNGISTLDAASRRAGYVVKSLRHYLRRNDGPEERSRVAIGRELDAILSLFEPRIRGIIEIQRDIDDSCFAFASRDQLAQVWMNLIDNALHSMDGRGRLGIAVRREGEIAVVEISDSGPGIPPEAAARLFEPFFTTKPQGQGTGLGLSISRRILEEHGGRISFTSSPGLTCFRVELPAAGDR